MDQDQQKKTNIQSLLAAPFVAAAHASSEMARQQAKFLIENSFDLEGESYKPKMIKMTITKSTIVDGAVKVFKSDFELPILTLLPVNTLAVKDISLKFDLEVATVISHTDAKDGKAGVTMHGGISYNANNNVAQSQDGRQSSFNKNSRANLSVEMTGGSVPLPTGFTTILDLYTKNIALSQTSSSDTENSDTSKPTEDNNNQST